MAYTPLTQIAISLQTSGISATGFGTIMFTSSHRYFKERSRSYTDLNSVAVDFPTTSNAYIAAQQMFSVTPRPALIKLGRREVDLDITVATGSTTASLTFEASDGTNDYSLTVNATGVDEDAVAADIQSQIEADGDIGPLVTATVATNVVSITPTLPTNTFWVSDLSDELSQTFQNPETAADMIAGIDLEDSDWYFLTADDHTQAFVTSAATTVEAQTRMYFMSSQESASLTAYNESTSTDVLASLAQNDYLRTKGIFHQTADTEFPECRFVAYNAGFSAGSVSWENLQLGLGAGRNPTTNNLLTTTEKGNIKDRAAGLMDFIGGIAILRFSGEVSNGTNRISTVRGRDAMESDMNVALTNLLINQQGSKLSYRDSDIARIRNTVESVLQKYVSLNFINDNYTMTFLLSDQVPLADKQANIYQSGSFEAELTGEIDEISLTGTLVLDLSA